MLYKRHMNVKYLYLSIPAAPHLLYVTYIGGLKTL